MGVLTPAALSSAGVTDLRFTGTTHAAASTNKPAIIQIVADPERVWWEELILYAVFICRSRMANTRYAASS